MIQEILVAVIFIAALAYVGWLFYKSFQPTEDCNTGCGKCSVVNDYRKNAKKAARVNTDKT